MSVAEHMRLQKARSADMKITLAFLTFFCSLLTAIVVPRDSGYRHTNDGNRLTIRGEMDGLARTLAYEMIDYYDIITNMTSRTRTTAFPTSIVAQIAGTV